MNLATRARGGATRSGPPLTFDQFMRLTGRGGVGRYLGAPTTTLGGNPSEEIDPSFEGLVQQAYAENGIVFACVLARMLLFSEASFAYEDEDGEMFTDRSLSPLWRPWTGATTRKLLARMEQDASMAGNAFVNRRPSGLLRRLRPDWVTIVKASETDSELDAEVIGYSYDQPGRRREIILPEDMAHYAPIPDPLADYRGMSWITAALPAIEADRAAETHKQKFFENGASPNMIVSLDKDIQQAEFDAWVDAFEDQHTGVMNAYKSLYFGGGADVKVIGKDFQQMDFKKVIGAGETRIAAAAGVPPIVVGLSEGLEAATYANYHQARRRFADGTVSPLWGEAAAALEPLLKMPARAVRLVHDIRGVPFLQEDEKDAADIQFVDAQSIKQLTDSGYTPESIRKCIKARDWGLLEHSGLVSVQLLPPGTEKPSGADKAAAA